MNLFCILMQKNAGTGCLRSIVWLERWFITATQLKLWRCLSNTARTTITRRIITSQVRMKVETSLVPGAPSSRFNPLRFEYLQHITNLCSTTRDSTALSVASESGGYASSNMDSLMFEDKPPQCDGKEAIKPSDRDVWVQLGLSLVLGLTAFTTFCFLRPRWPTLYAARKRRLDPKIGLPPLPDTFLGWIPGLYRVTEEQVLASAGLDAFVVSAKLSLVTGHTNPTGTVSYLLQNGYTYPGYTGLLRIYRYATHQWCART